MRKNPLTASENAHLKKKNLCSLILRGKLLDISNQSRNFVMDSNVFSRTRNTCKLGVIIDNLYGRGFQTMGIGTQTWVALALSLGRGPFCDPKK